MATSNFPIYNYYILYTIYYILYLIYIYITLYAYYIIYYILWFYNIYGIYYWFYYIWYSFLWISHWNTILFVRIPISHDAPRAPPRPRLGAIGSARPRRAAFRIGRSRNWWRLQMLGEFSTGTAKPVEHGEFTNQNIRFFMGFIWKIP
jgi:hypothetical protein